MPDFVSPENHPIFDWMEERTSLESMAERKRNILHAYHAYGLKDVELKSVDGQPVWDMSYDVDTPGYKLVTQYVAREIDFVEVSEQLNDVVDKAFNNDTRQQG